MRFNVRRTALAPLLLLAPVLLLAAACSGDNDAAPATPSSDSESVTVPASTYSESSYPSGSSAAQATPASDGEAIAVPTSSYSGSYSNAVRAPRDAPPPSTTATIEQLFELSAAYRQLTLWGNGAGGIDFSSPNGLAIDGDDNVYITEARGNRFRKFSPEGDQLLDVGGEGAGPGEFLFPIGIAVDADGYIYVSEAGGHRVQRFAADGTPVASWGSQGSQPGNFLSAMGIAVSDAGEVFVADFGNHRVQVFDRDGAFLRQWGGLGTGPDQFNNPIGVQIGPAGNVWVVDSGNQRVQVFTQQGDFVRLFDDVGPGPQILSLNAAGEFYVSSPWVEGRVRHFSAEGELLGYVGNSVTEAELAEMSSADAQRVAELSLLDGPHGTATDTSGAVYVADTANGVVRKFEPVGDG